MSPTEAGGLGRSSPPCRAGRGDERREGEEGEEEEEEGGGILNEANSQEKRKGKGSKLFFGNCNKKQKKIMYSFEFIFSKGIL